MTRWNDRRGAGFTLIELLVVIAIITILASLVMPSIALAIKQAERATCASQLRQLHQGLFTYAKDHKGHFLTRVALSRNPGWSTAVRGALSLDQAMPIDFRDAFWPRYIPDASLFYCPSSKFGGFKSKWNSPQEEPTWTQGCPSINYPWNWTGCSGQYYPCTFWSYFYAPLYTGVTAAPNYPTSYTAPPDTLLICDKICIFTQWDYCASCINHSEGKAEGLNEAFLDGSVEWIPYYCPVEWGEKPTAWESDPGKHGWHLYLQLGDRFYAYYW